MCYLKVKDFFSTMYTMDKFNIQMSNWEKIHSFLKIIKDQYPKYLRKFYCGHLMLPDHFLLGS